MRLKKQTVQQNSMGVRRCTPDCYFFKNGGTGCSFYQEAKVKYNELCLHDMENLKSYADAFATGDLDFVKKEASSITGMLMMSMRRMVDQIANEGVTVDEPIVDGKGNPIYIPDPNWRESSGKARSMVVAMRKVDHPLIQRVIQLSRSLGINLSEFRLTSKSADEKRQVAGHVIAENPQTLEEVMSNRKEIEDKFLEAIEKGTKMTKDDPVFKQLSDSGEIIN